MVSNIYITLGNKIHGLSKSQMRFLLGVYCISKSFIRLMIAKRANYLYINSIKVKISL